MSRTIIRFVKGYPRCLRRQNFALLMLVGILLFTGIMFIYGAGQQAGDQFRGMWAKQIVWIGLGAGLMGLLMRIDYRRWQKGWFVVYGITVAMLVMVLIIGIEVNGARSWFKIGPFTLQPSEFGKLGLLVALAWLGAQPNVDFRKWRYLLAAAGLTLIPMVLIGLQPDYGSALTLAPICAVVIFMGGLPKRWLFYALIVGVLAAPITFKHGLSDHQRNRILTFANPERDLQGAGWNAYQSLLAVGSGGLNGKGYGNGTQNTLGFLPRPVSTTDFIFSVIAEEMGFIGSAALVFVFMLLIITIFHIGSRCEDRFGRFLAFGIAMLLSVHIYINIGMTMGMAPIIGIPLPFVSYGGSFMLMTMACVGLLQSIYIHRKSAWTTSLSTED